VNFPDPDLFPAGPRPYARSLGIHPSPDLVRFLGWGAIAALLAGGLSASGLVVELLRGRRPPFTFADGLGLAAIVPQILVLCTYLKLAGAAGSQGLRRSSLCMFITFWAHRLLGLVKTPTTDEGALLVVIPTLLVTLAGIGFSVWFAGSLIRLRGELGVMAAVVGWAEILRTLGYVVLLVLMIQAGLGAPEDLPVNDPRLDELMAPLDKAAALRALIGWSVTAVLTVCFFLAVRDRAADRPG
jgi:hypothetical protein